MELEQYQGAIENLCHTLDLKISRKHKELNKIRKSHKLPEL